MNQTDTTDTREKALHLPHISQFNQDDQGLEVILKQQYNL